MAVQSTKLKDTTLQLGGGGARGGHREVKGSHIRTYNIYLQCLFIYKLAINVTTDCSRGCTANVGVLVTKERQSKRKGNRQKKNPVDGNTKNFKGDVEGGG